MNADLNASLSAAHAEVKAEIAKTDNKTGLLLAFIGALLAGVWTVAKDVHLPAAAIAVGGAGVALLVTAAGVLLRAVRPNLRGNHGFPMWATVHPEVLPDTLSQDLAATVVGLSRLAVAKFTRLRRAVDLTCVAGVLLIVAALIAVGGAL
ncbi:Pycsar system effector family protein [Streptomyces sp. NPDC093109]|uniref:Pycsar system effector family protein n=1 Tax=Streptomyces sp. NPDC093109 TaxID=3154977 RepID=UPI00344BC2B2